MWKHIKLILRERENNMRKTDPSMQKASQKRELSRYVSVS